MAALTPEAATMTGAVSAAEAGFIHSGQQAQEKRRDRTWEGRYLDAVFFPPTIKHPSLHPAVTQGHVHINSIFNVVSASSLGRILSHGRAC